MALFQKISNTSHRGFFGLTPTPLSYPSEKSSLLFWFMFPMKKRLLLGKEETADIKQYRKNVEKTRKIIGL